MKTFKEISTMITGKLLEAIQGHLTTQDFAIDEGEVRIIDRDDATIFYGLFLVDDSTKSYDEDPSIIWSIEVFGDVQGEDQTDSD